MYITPVTKKVLSKDDIKALLQSAISFDLKHKTQQSEILTGAHLDLAKEIDNGSTDPTKVEEMKDLKKESRTIASGGNVVYYDAATAEFVLATTEKGLGMHELLKTSNLEQYYKEDLATKKPILCENTEWFILGRVPVTAVFFENKGGELGAHVGSMFQNELAMNGDKKAGIKGNTGQMTKGMKEFHEDKVEKDITDTTTGKVFEDACVKSIVAHLQHSLSRNEFIRLLDNAERVGTLDGNDIREVVTPFGKIVENKEAIERYIGAIRLVLKLYLKEEDLTAYRDGVARGIFSTARKHDGSPFNDAVKETFNDGIVEINTRLIFSPGKTTSKPLSPRSKEKEEMNFVSKMTTRMPLLEPKETSRKFFKEKERESDPKKLKLGGSAVKKAPIKGLGTLKKGKARKK